MNVKPIWTNSTYETVNKIDSDSYHLPFYVYFKIKKQIILDKKPPIFDQELLNIGNIMFFFSFRYIKGFDVDSYNDETISLDSFLDLNFYDSSLAFYLNGRRLKSCLDFPSKPKSILQMIKIDFVYRYGQSLNYYFINVKYEPLCPLAFANSQIDRINFGQLSNTFFKTNIPTFTDLPPNVTHINSKILRLTLNGYGEIALNHRIIHPHVFNQIEEFIFEIGISKIEKGVFKSMKNLKLIYIYMDYWRPLAHKGLAWIYDLNSHIRVDLNDSAMIEKYLENRSSVEIWCVPKYYEIAEGLKPRNIFPDEDFCIYTKFPFEQMVYWYSFEIGNQKFSKISCTNVWLIQPKVPRQSGINMTDYIDIFNKCDFNKRFAFNFYHFIT